MIQMRGWARGERWVRVRILLTTSLFSVLLALSSTARGCCRCAKPSASKTWPKNNTCVRLSYPRGEAAFSIAMVRNWRCPPRWIPCSRIRGRCRRGTWFRSRRARSPGCSTFRKGACERSRLPTLLRMAQAAGAAG